MTPLSQFRPRLSNASPGQRMAGPQRASGGALRDAVQKRLPQFLKELQEFVRIPSISSDPRRAADVKQGAEWLAKRLREAGLDHVKVISTKRHPLVYADWLKAPGQRTLLIYGHYDVQPPGPPGVWQFPPFAGLIRDKFIHGRGASDDKGQLLIHVNAMRTLLQTTGKLPVNVKGVFEGEEEIDGANLIPFLERNRRALRADAAVMSDTRMLSADQPALTYGLRGQLALEVALRGPGHDLHSGSYGGAVHGPLQALCELVARMHDRQKRVAVPGFYDRVREPGVQERKALADSGPGNRELLRQIGAPQSWGESGYSLLERIALRPSLTVSGLTGGHGGPGPKGVIPRHALAKLTFRLVPDQDPDEIEELVRRFIAEHTPPTVRAEVRVQIRSHPVLLSRKGRAMEAAHRAYQKVFGRPPVWIRSGGSIAVVAHFQKSFGIPTVLLGFASPEDNMHGPNEKFSIRNFQRGILTVIAFLHELARQPSRKAL